MPPPTQPSLARLRAGRALAALAAGFLLARHIHPLTGSTIHSATWFAIAILLAALSLPLRGRACSAAILAMVLSLAAGWFTLRILEAPADRLTLPIEPDEAVIRVEGVVAEGAAIPPLRGALAEFAIAGRAHRLLLDLKAVETPRPDGGATWSPASGRLVVFVDADDNAPLDLPPGRRIRLSGRASAPGPPTNPGQSDQRLWSAQRAIVGTMTVPDPALIESAAGDAGPLDPITRSLRRAREWLTDRARAGIDSIQDDRSRALVASLMLGAEEEEGRAIATRFQRLGLAHVLAISGVHVAMLAWATLLLVRLFGDVGPLEPIIAATVVLLYLMVVPAEAPVVRSAVMVLALLLGEALGRRYDGVVILAWTAAALLILRPMDLWSLGFQLSFGVTGVLLGASRTFHERLWGPRSPLAEIQRDPPWWKRLATTLAQAASVSLLAWAVASPWIAARVGLFSPVAPISSLLVAAPIGLLMLAGFVSLLIGTLIPGADAVWLIADPLSRASLACVDWLDGLPGSSMATGSVPLSWGLAASIGVLWLLSCGSFRNAPRGLYPGIPWHERYRGVATGLILAGLTLWLLAALILGRSLPARVVARIDTLDVGDATCHILRSGDDAMLWDCGASWAGAGEVRIPGAVRALGVPPVRTALITHANFDHFNTLPDAAWRLGVRRILVSPLLLERAAREPRSATAAMLNLLRAQDIEIVQVGPGTRLRFGECELEFLWPDEAQASPWPANDQSLAAMLSIPTRAGPRRILLTGDIQTRAIAAMLETPSRLRADIIEAPHHGAFTTQAAALVEAASPSHIIQSTGRTRTGLGRVNDPRWAEAAGAATWHTTATDGALYLEVHRDGSITTGRHTTPEPK